ncbi:N-acetylmuramoyl-L-alanine amidase [Nocardia goodfellowii]
MSKDRYALAIIHEGKRRRITPRGIVIALATALVESNLIMYANERDPESLNFPHERLSYDKNSAGLFQQRAEWWGTVADRMDPARSAGMFYEALARLDYNNESNSPGWYAQQVQRSAFPDRYDERMPEAHALYTRLVGLVPAAGKVPMSKPAFTEIDKMGNSCSPRSRPPINFFLHTQEGDGSAVSLADYLNNPVNQVSYHYAVRDGIVADVVDTDMYSWSVLDANVFSINLCFAGSYAGWSREQWLQRERDIEIAAYIAVQDCQKYGIPIRVIRPPYAEGPGISDHRYVTECLGIGNHTDVGNGFPWDVFEKYVAHYSGINPQLGDSELSWGEVIKNLNDQPVSREDMIKFMDARLERVERLAIALLDQIGGTGVGEAVAKGEPTRFDGFPQGGNRSAYDLLAAVAEKEGVTGAVDLKKVK